MKTHTKKLKITNILLKFQNLFLKETFILVCVYVPPNCQLYFYIVLFILWFHILFSSYQHIHALLLYSLITGSLPSRNDGNVAMTTCLQTENNTCEMTLNINITKCGGYYVYYMVNTPTNSSYCVGKKYSIDYKVYTVRQIW